jgi:hypothetical protein
MWIADAHRDGKRLLRADEKLTAFVELESAISTLDPRGSYPMQLRSGTVSLLPGLAQVFSMR